MTHEQFMTEAGEFIEQLLNDRTTDKYGFAVFALLYKASQAGRTREMYSLIHEFGLELRNGADDDWPDLIVD